MTADLGQEPARSHAAAAPRQDDQVGARERRRRLAESAPREEAARPPRRASIQADDLHVLQESPLLEPVVEQHHVGPEVGSRPPPRLEAVLADHDADAGKPPGQQERLVTCPLGRQPWRSAIRDQLDRRARPPAVPAAHHRYPTPLVHEPARHHLDRRRLAGPAHA